MPRHVVFDPCFRPLLVTHKGFQLLSAKGIVFVSGSTRHIRQLHACKQLRACKVFRAVKRVHLAVAAKMAFSELGRCKHTKSLTPHVQHSTTQTKSHEVWADIQADRSSTDESQSLAGLLVEALAMEPHMDAYARNVAKTRTRRTLLL